MTHDLRSPTYDYQLSFVRVPNKSINFCMNPLPHKYNCPHLHINIELS